MGIHVDILQRLSVWAEKIQLNPKKVKINLFISKPSKKLQRVSLHQEMKRRGNRDIVVLG